MASGTPQPNRSVQANRSVRSKRTVSGPSRLKNKKKERIVAMIDGYESITSISAALATVFALWAVLSLVMVAAGLLGLSMNTSTSESQDKFLMIVRALQGGVSFFSLFTGTFFVVWVIKARHNVPRIGKQSRVGVGAILKRHLIALAVAFLAGFALLFVPASLSRLLLVVVIGSLVWASLVINMLVFSMIKMLWQSGTAPGSEDDLLPEYATAWLVSWVVFGFLGSTLSWGATTFSVGTLAVLLLAQGASGVVASLGIAALVWFIAVRQESRIEAIIGQDDPSEDTDSMVTTEQINDAWADSDKLIQMDR